MDVTDVMLENVSVTANQSGILTQSAAKDLIRLKYSNHGQTIRLYNSDGNSNLHHNVELGQGSNILTLSDGGLSLKLNVNFVATVDATLTLISDGSQWFELARSSN